MKILHLANHAQKIGNGIVNVMVDLACLQARAGHEVAVASSGGNFEPLLQRYGARHFMLRQSKHPWRVAEMLLGFRKIASDFSPDIVHAHMMTGALLAKLGRYRRDYTLITTIHNEFQRSSNLMRVGDQVVAVSDAVATSMVRRGIPAARMSVVINGIIGAPRFEDRASNDDGGPVLQHPNIVTVSGLYERKGMFDLLNAFRLVLDRRPDIHLYLVGNGPDRQKLEARARELGLADRAHFAGYVTDPGPYYRQADVFVLPSHADSCPLAILEAREVGCAIVGTRVGGIPELLDEGAAGIIVPPHMPEMLAPALLMLHEDEALRRSWQARARANLAPMSAQRVYDEYQQIYAATIARRQAEGLCASA